MPYEPSPSEIKRICEQEIQPAWDERMKKKRMRSDAEPVHCEIQVVSLRSLPDQLETLIESINKDHDK